MSERTNKILCGDALEVLKTLPSESVQCCVTSPPYYGLRDYGMTEQIGLEESPNAYVKRLIEVFREVRRVLAPDGTLWLIVADSYAGSGKGASTPILAKRHKSKQSYVFTSDDPAAQTPKEWPGIKPKDMLGIPWMLAFTLREDGWYLRSDIIWHKPNAMPHPVQDRPANCYEHVFLLAKSKRYYFDYTALQMPVAKSSIERMHRGFHATKYSGGAPGQTPQLINQPKPSGEAPTLRRGRDIWDIGTNNYRAAHFATFPVELVKLCILAGCPKGGVVLDPFIGSGTTGIAATLLDCRYIGIELNPDYCILAQTRISERR